MNELKSIAIFMCFLIITIPFYVSSVFATYTGELSNLDFEKTISKRDSFDVAVSANLNSGTQGDNQSNSSGNFDFNQNNLKIIYDNNEKKFDSCQGSSGAYTCSYSSGFRDILPGKHDFEVKLYDNHYIRLDRLSDVFYVDATPPTISRLIMPDSITSETEITYDIVDTACPGCKICSGIGKISLVFDGVVKETIDGSGNPLSGNSGAVPANTTIPANTTVPANTTLPANATVPANATLPENTNTNPDNVSCRLDGKYTLNADGLTQGTSKFCFVVEDTKGNNASSCKDVFVDSEQPVFSEVMVVDNEGLPMKFVGKGKTAIILKINITDTVSGVDQDSIVGSFSGFTSQEPRKYENVKPFGCTADDGENTLTCTWALYAEGMNGSARVNINATDNAGNIGSYSSTVSLPLDADAPEIVAIDSSFGSNSSRFLRATDNRIIVDVLESGSGLSKNNAYLTIPSLGIVKTDGCNDTTGLWECAWDGIDINSIIGSHIDLYVNKLNDDAGNPAVGKKTESFLYDGEMPRFTSITIEPEGTGLDILIDGDVATIKAKIIEKHSGLWYAEADYSVFSPEGVFTPADECTKLEGVEYECVWHYTGPITAGDKVLNIRASDYAGNLKESKDDGVVGKIFAAGVTDREVDYWADDAEVYDVGKLNRNFLWMSSEGTIVRAGIRLLGGGSYVHAFNIISCQGGLSMSGSRMSNATTMQDFSIKDQFYYPGKEKSDKYVLINVPPMDKGNLGNASYLQIVCDGEVLQASSQRGNVFKPDEPVKATIMVELTDPIFSTPDLSAIDKITTKKKEVEFLDTWIKNINWWVKWMQPLCTIVNLIMQLLSGVCQLWNGVELAFGKEGPSQCFLQFDLLDRIWYGKRTPDGSIENPALGGLNSKSLMSMGFWCDLVLCEDCSKMWKKNIFNDVFGLDIDAMTSKWSFWGISDKKADYPRMTPDERDRGLGTYAPRVSFSPDNSLLVALACMPPCLPTLVAKMQALKSIYATYNVCYNVASVRGTDVSECDSYLSSQVCQQVVGEFWYLIDSFIKDYITKALVYVFDQKLLRLGECGEHADVTKTTQNVCMAKRIYRIIGWFLQLSETINTMDNIGNHEYFKTDKEVEDGAKNALGE